MVVNLPRISADDEAKVAALLTLTADDLEASKPPGRFRLNQGGLSKITG